jgi:hypothetical protein
VMVSTARFLNPLNNVHVRIILGGKSN